MEEWAVSEWTQRIRTLMTPSSSPEAVKDSLTQMIRLTGELQGQAGLDCWSIRDHRVPGRKVQCLCEDSLVCLFMLAQDCAHRGVHSAAR